MCIANSYGCIRFYVFTLAVNPIPTLYICRTNVTKRIYYWLQKRTVLPFLFICWTISRNLVVIGLYITCNNLRFKQENVNYSCFYLAFKSLRVWYFHKWHKWYSFWSIFLYFTFAAFIALNWPQMATPLVYSVQSSCQDFVDTKLFTPTRRLLEKKQFASWFGKY